MDKNCIYLINISSDPSLANQLFYFLKEGPNSIGTEKQNTITIKGLGIQDIHCTLHRTKNEGGDDQIVIEPLSENAKVSINGKKIEGKTLLKHLDRVVCGYDTGFKLIFASQSKPADDQNVQDYD